jgi:predicted acetyltransferase
VSELGASGRGAAQPLVALELIAQRQVRVLENLFELYAYDLSDIVPLELHSNGRFDVGPGDIWWSTDDHFPFLVRCEGKLVGFALVRKGSRVTGDPRVMDVAEFFVVRGARRKKIGTSVAHALFRAFPGRWELRVRRANTSAMAFWSRASSEWLGSPVSSLPFSIDGIDWDVLQIGDFPK